MLDDRHLTRGFNALCRAHQRNFFFDGHKGGALISATYFVREAEPEEGVGALLEKKITQAWGKSDLFADFAKEKAAPARVDRIKQRLQSQCCTLRRAAHNWILASLALKVLSDVPALATPTRMDGLEKLIDKFDQVTTLKNEERIEVPSPKSANAYSAFVLAEFIRTAKRFDGRGQGWTGHLCTFGRALLDLQACGHGDLAEEGRAMMAVYMRRVRTGPLDTDRPRKEKAQDKPSALTLAYWKKAGINYGLGHAFKYPYGFYGLLAQVKDEDVKERALKTFWRISS